MNYFSNTGKSSSVWPWHFHSFFLLISKVKFPFIHHAYWKMCIQSKKHVFVLIVCELMEQLQYIDKYFNNSKKSITDFFSRLWKNWITNSINTLKNVMKTCDWEKPNSSKARKVVIPPLTIAGPIFKRLLTARSSRVPRKISILF